MVKRLLKVVVPERVIQMYHYFLARLATVWYGHPSEKLIVIGVTGTNGKSTTVQFIGRLLEHMGERVGWTTTASFKVAEHEWPNDKKMTMLGRFQTHKLLRQMVDANCRYAIVETSSQGLAQFRHVGVHYDAAVCTNLTPEHIEAHGGFEAYKKAKEQLFDALARSQRKIIHEDEIQRVSVVNIDDPHAASFLSYDVDKQIGFGIKSHDTDAILQILSAKPVIPESIECSGTCTTFVWNDQIVHFKPIGIFYLQNVLAAMALVQALGRNPEEIRRAVESLLPVPGRLEMIDEGQPFSVVVDYAYEPAALRAAYEALELISHRRLIHIVGSAGGGRDVARRAILGTLSAEHDDVVIVTNEDPYDEDPMQIIHDVADGAQRAGKQDQVNLFRILDRQEAIDLAIKIAQPEDLVLMTGKGSEPVMAVAGGKKIPWDDRLAARKALKQLL